jgi:curved DNA-binding protein CbpA
LTLPSSDSSAPAASGKLRDRPVPRLIQQVFRKRVTGCLVVTDDSGDVTRVYLRDGLPVHADRPTDIDRLDNILVSAGLVSHEVVEAAQSEMARTSRRLGEILIARGAIQRKVLAEVLKTQMRRKVTRLFFARQGTFQVFVEAHQYGLGPEFELMRVDPRAFLYPGIRAAYDDERLKEELKPLAGYSFRLVTTVPPAFLEAMGLPPKDATLAVLRQKALTIDDLPVAPSKAVESRAVVVSLLYSDLLDATASAARSGVPASGMHDALSEPVVALHDKRTTWTAVPVLGEKTHIAAAPAPTPAAALRTSGVQPALSSPSASSAAGSSAEALRAAILELHQKLEHSSHFEILGVPENASNAEVNAAYMRAVRQYHPDRLAAAGLRDLTPQAEKVMARMGEASAVLRDSRLRADYLASRSGRKSQASEAVTLVDAEKSFQRGEAYLKKGDYPRALESFTEAVKINPSEAQYRAYLAWARFDDPHARKDLVARESLATIQQAVSESPRFARGFYWIGQIWKHLNDMPHAEKAFREAANLDKGFLEAEREVRLLEMRRARESKGRSTGPTSAARPTGLLNKILKRNE